MQRMPLLQASFAHEGAVRALDDEGRGVVSI
jgi:hypothetical protein